MRGLKYIFSAVFRDGQLKRMKAKPEWKEKQQEEFSKRLKVDTKKQE